MPKPQKHVFVCTQQRPPGHPRGSCGQLNSGAVMEEFLMQTDKRNAFDKIQITPTGCMGPCTEGATVLVYPEGVMYGKVSVEDVAAIYDEHLEGDKPVERLLMNPAFWS